MANADEAYRTVAEGASASFTVQGSEFIGHVTPVESIERAEAFVERVGKEYDDATHNVPAYRVRQGGSAERSSANRSSGRRPRDSTLGSGMLREYSTDDGEPSGSAGKPTLNVLQGQELENVACVVARYYSGTNLGIGGLVRAYGRAAKEAIDAAGVIEERPHERATVVVEYDDSGTVRAVLESAGVEFDATYETAVTFDVRVPTTDAEALYDRLRSATNGRVRIE